MQGLILYLFSVQPQMELKPNCGSDRAWVWTSTSDFADGEPKPELLAIRFANSESKYKSAVLYRNNIVKGPRTAGFYTKLNVWGSLGLNFDYDWGPIIKNGGPIFLYMDLP